jgi:uncharacterized protein YbaR (Trm112 family)
MNVGEQIELGLLVCPKTRQKLVITDDGEYLENITRTERYRFANGTTPILLLDKKWAEQYASSSERMSLEYSAQERDSLRTRIRRTLIRDYRTKASQEAFRSLFDGLPDSALCLSVGGGPTREHSKLTNLNIGPFPNVDVVADAHCLPYADGVVDVVYCEAVFEHLHTPTTAAREMLRVLKHGGQAFVCTPSISRLPASLSKLYVDWA